MVNENCKPHYTPTEYVIVDETLLVLRGICSFRMFIPQKPEKYVLKIISLCDARSFLFSRGLPYIGKKTRGRNDLLFPFQFILKLTEQLKGTNPNVIFDIWFSIWEFPQEFLRNYLISLSILRKGKKEILPIMVERKLKAAESLKFSFDDTKTIVYQFPKKN